MLSAKGKSRNRNNFSPDGTSSSMHLGSTQRVWLFLRWTVGLSLCVVILFGVVLAMFAAYRYATTSDFFALQRVDIRGATHFRREDILKAAALEAGKNTLTINISNIEATLSNNPWVTHVAVKRRLPNAFEIQVTERVPAFWLLKDGALQYADKKGAIIAPVEAGNFISLPTLEILPGGETLQGRVGELMDSLHKADLPLDLAAISTLRLSSAKGLEIVMENMRLTICISPDDWEQNIRRLDSVLRDLARRGELKNTREIWLADGSVWVIMTPQTTAPGVLQSP